MSQLILVLLASTFPALDKGRKRFEVSRFGKPIQPYLTDEFKGTIYTWIFGALIIIYPLMVQLQVGIEVELFFSTYMHYIRYFYDCFRTTVKHRIIEGHSITL